MNVTQPAVLCFNGHVPEEKTLRNNYLEVEANLQSIKEVKLQCCVIVFGLQSLSLCLKNNTGKMAAGLYINFKPGCLVGRWLALT